MVIFHSYVKLPEGTYRNFPAVGTSQASGSYAWPIGSPERFQSFGVALFDRNIARVSRQA